MHFYKSDSRIYLIMWKFLYVLLLVRLAECDNCYTTKPKAYRGFCVENKDKIYVGDFDGNGSEDLLCHNTFSGKVQIIYSSKDPFHATEWSKDLNWCKSSVDQLYIGDFNGDKRSDLLCHNTKTGAKYYAFATNDGQFTGTSFWKAMGWCTHGGAKLYVGDFSGDGKDDIMCHDTNNRLWLGYANSAGHIHGTSVHLSLGDCKGSPFVGDFDRDGKADIMCVDISSGIKRVLLFNKHNRNQFTRVYDNTNKNNKWCTGHAFARVADVDGDGFMDLICKNYQAAAPLWVMRNKKPYYFDKTNDHFNFCHVAPNSRFLIGDFDGNGKKDFACHDGAGHIQVTLSHCHD